MSKINFLELNQNFDKKRSTTAEIYKVLTSSRGDVKIVSRVKNSSSIYQAEQEASHEHWHYSKITDIINI